MGLSALYLYAGLGLLLVVGVFLFKALSAKKVPKMDQSLEPRPEEKVEVLPPPIPVLTWSERLKKGLEKSRKEVWGKLATLVPANGDWKDSMEAIEELLFTADMAPSTVEKLMQEMQKNSGQLSESAKDINIFKTFLYDFLKNEMSPVQSTQSKDILSSKKGPTVVMIVGVNGAGKTTTIGKLATKWKGEGKKVVVGACDTFRAAAVEQLAVWCSRAEVEMVRAADNADPSGVAYETLSKAQANGADICLIDTAGRLHTKTNLMEELKKMKKVLQKLDPTAPHQVWLVIDAITGQNALNQAQEFNQALGLTGLVFTKCDGSSKSGNAVAIVEKLKVPVTFIGVGEQVEDLERFVLEDYLKALLDLESAPHGH